MPEPAGERFFKPAGPCVEKSLPDLPVTGFIPRLSGTPEKDIARAEHLAAGLGIRPISLPPMSEVQPGSAEEGCLSACRIRALADEEGALLLSSLNGTDITTDLRAIRAACTADFMPLKDLYESELAALFPEFATASPEAVLRDGLLMRLHREHVSATHLAALMPDRELEIRRLQRLARTTEWDRRKLPPGLFLRSIPGTPEVPAIHQMAD